MRTILIATGLLAATANAQTSPVISLTEGLYVITVQSPAADLHDETVRAMQVGRAYCLKKFPGGEWDVQGLTKAEASSGGVVFRCLSTPKRTVQKESCDHPDHCSHYTTRE